MTLKPAVVQASFYINPLNRNLILWDVFMGLLIVYEVTIIPYIIAYHVPPEGRAMIFDIFTVFAYVIDMLLRWETPIVLQQIYE